MYMEMKQYLKETFQFNDYANKLVFRRQGVEPGFVDYIGTRYRRLSRP